MAAITYPVNVNGVTYNIHIPPGTEYTWLNSEQEDSSYNMDYFTVTPGNYVLWSNDEYLAYQGVPVRGTDLVQKVQYTTTPNIASRVTCDLATAFADKWAALGAGEHTVRIRAKNPGNYLDSDLSSPVTVLKIVNYSVTANLANCTAATSNPTVVPSNTTGTVLKFTANTGYDLPASVTVTGATSSWNRSTGELTLTKPTGDVAITIVATAQTYSITVNATNATAATSNPATIVYGGGATLRFTFPDGYYAPTSVTVTGATQSWNATTATLTLSNCTGAVTVTIEGVVKTYTITPNLTNCTWNGKNPTTIASNQFTAIQLDIIKNTGWTLPTEISVSGVDAEYWSWNQSTGTVTISHPQGNVTVTVNAVREVYTITTTTESATADPTNPTTIGYGLTATLKFTFPTGYEAPADDNVTVTGATKAWTQSTGTLVLSNPTGNVTVKVVGVEAVTEITGMWTWKETIPDATWTEQSVDFKLSDGTSYKKMYWSGDGTTYDLYYDDMLEGGSETKVYSYNADESTGTWVDAKYRIVDFTPDTGIQYVTNTFYNYLTTNATQATQLAAPQNVTAEGTVVSWDEVENATSYEVYADGASIGTVKESQKVTISTSSYNNLTVYETDTLGTSYTADPVNASLLGTLTDSTTKLDVSVSKKYLAIVVAVDGSSGHPWSNGKYWCTTSGGVTQVAAYPKTDTSDVYGALFYYDVTGQGAVDMYKTCLTGDTLVTMSDNTQKRLDTIALGDSVLSVDFATGKLIPRKVVYTDKDEDKVGKSYDIWKFSDGTEIKTVHRHEFYNVESASMKYMDEWKLGEHTLKQDGTHPTLIGHELVNKPIRHYKITLEGNTAYFANGLLTGDRYCPTNIKL